MKSYKRCYETHPALSLGGGLSIVGGSCGSPIHLDADVYIGLDLSMRRTPRRFPWEDGSEILFPIRDMGVPDDLIQFRKLVDWTVVQLTAHRKVHVGCIGGHGRTGMVLAAIVKVMLDNKNAIAYVRENYCAKAVESEEQIRFLHSHFGIEKVAATKGSYVEVPTQHGMLDLRTSREKWMTPIRAEGRASLEIAGGQVPRGKLYVPPRSSEPPVAPLKKPINVPDSVWGPLVTLTNV